MELLRTMAFFGRGEAERFFIFVFSCSVSWPMIPGKGKFSTPGHAQPRFACGDTVRLYSVLASNARWMTARQARPSIEASREAEKMSINTIIVDDEKPARDELAFLLKGFPEINVIGQGKNGVEAVSLIKEHTPDLVFLDVKMPGLDGFGVLKKIVERKMKMPHVVFAKPFDKARIAKAIARARKMLETQTSATERLEQLVSQLGAAKQNSSPPVKVLVKSQQRLLLIDGEDLIWASIDGGMISVMAREAEGTSNYRTLEELGEALDSESFWKPHRSFLVNIHHIKEVVPWFNATYMLKMDDKKQTQIPVGRSQVKRMRELFKL